jgi:hypothetical protein
MGLGLIHNGHVAVFLELLEMNVNQAPQFLYRRFRLSHRIPEPFENLARFVL